MTQFGLKVRQGSGGTKIDLKCEHQDGLLYVIPSEANWVCSEDLLPAHALAGLFKQLAGLDDHRVWEIMQRWGVYYRERQLAAQHEPGEEQQA